ncbi:MAG: transposase, partial [Candidatus Cloacimonetes bacterium]|nr:transposase [Candidatus Cloacimonadota bacterium]
SQIQRFKSYTATEILNYLRNISKSKVLNNFNYLNKLTHSKHKLWEEGFHPKMIENVNIMNEKVKYIHGNPVRRGYIDNPADWRYSSARNYEGQPGLIDVITDW